MILRLHNHALARPLPKLGLGGPKLFGVSTDYESCMLSLFLPFLFSVQRIHPLRLVVVACDLHSYSTPSVVRQQLISNAPEADGSLSAASVCLLDRRINLRRDRGTLRYARISLSSAHASPL